MKIEMTKSDVEDEFSKVVVLHGGQQKFINLLKRAVEPYGYNAGVYGWNYDVYKLNGIGLVEGYRIPNFRNEARFSQEIMDNAVEKAEEVVKNNRKPENIPSYNYEKEKSEVKDALKVFTDSVRQGVHDPSVIRTFADYKRELVDQKKQHPHEDILTAAKRLDSHFYDEEARKKINGELKKQMENYEAVTKDKQACLESVLNNIYQRDPEVVRKNIYNDLNRKDRLPVYLDTVSDLRAAQGVFTAIKDGGKTECQIEAVARYFAANNANCKFSKKKGSYEISFEKIRREKKQALGIEK